MENASFPISHVHTGTLGKPSTRCKVVYPLLSAIYFFTLAHVRKSFNVGYLSVLLTHKAETPKSMLSNAERLFIQKILSKNVILAICYILCNILYNYFSFPHFHHAHMVSSVAILSQTESLYLSVNLGKRSPRGSLGKCQWLHFKVASFKILPVRQNNYCRPSDCMMTNSDTFL